MSFACPQRGEGLNYHLKRELSLRSGLTKLYHEVCFRIKKESARTFKQDLKLTITFSDIGGYARQMLPVIYKEACALLTPYGLARFITQIQAGSLYWVSPVVDLSQQQEQPEPQALLEARPNEDPEYCDLPCPALLDLVAQHNIDITGATVFRVVISPLVNKDGELVPQHVVLWDRLPAEGGANTRHLCTCGFGVRGGVPCRHFWAVAINSRQASFNFGQVNDLWFQVAQKVIDTVEVFVIDGQVSGRGGLCSSCMFMKVHECCAGIQRNGNTLS